LYVDASITGKGCPGYPGQGLIRKRRREKMNERPPRGMNAGGRREGKYGIFLNARRRGEGKHVTVNKLPCFDGREHCDREVSRKGYPKSR
jgi:hypothetical protein